MDIEKHFEENCYSVNFEKLSELNKKNPSEGLINFINGIKDFVYGAIVPDKENSKIESIHLLFAEYKRDYDCYILPVPIDEPDANELVFFFSNEINYHHPERDVFTIFNTLQHFRRTVLESLGYFTFNPFVTPNGSFLSTQPIIKVWRIDRVDFYRDMFSDLVDNPKLDPIKKVYLMVDNTNGLIKIGNSKDPKYREGTLQSKEPETHLIASWTAPIQIETELHRKYIKKRIRGEWFRLTIGDLEEIKNYMNDLE